MDLTPATLELFGTALSAGEVMFAVVFGAIALMLIGLSLFVAITR